MKLSAGADVRSADNAMTATDSDSDAEIEHPTYERRREANVRKIIILERLFAQVKKQLHHERMQQLEARQVELLKQTAADYLIKKAILIREHQERSEYNKVLRELQRESLRRKMIGKLETARVNLVNNRKLSYEKVEADIQSRIDAVKLEKEKCLASLQRFALECKEHPKRRKHSEKMEEKLRRSVGGPIIFYMPRKEDLEADLNFADNALQMVRSQST